MSLTLENISNPRFANAAGTLIDCDLKWAELAQPIPFTANQNDGEAHGRAIFDLIMQGQFGAVAPYVVQLDAVKAQRNEQINRWRAEAIKSGVEFGGVMFDSDDVSRANLTGVVAAVNAGIPLPANFTWRSADNQDVPMDLAALVGLAGTMLAHVNAQYTRSWQRKAAVAAAQTAEAVEAVTW